MGRAEGCSVQAWPGPGVTGGFGEAPEPRLGGGALSGLADSAGTSRNRAWLSQASGRLGAARHEASPGRCLGSLVGHPRPPSSLGVALVLGHGHLRGHQEEDVGLQVHHGFLPGLLGRVLGPGLGVRLVRGIGTSESLGDSESADQLIEVLPADTKQALDPPPCAHRRVSATL